MQLLLTSLLLLTNQLPSQVLPFQFVATHPCSSSFLTLSPDQIASHRLSAQPHYEFGMRALKSVLLVAGELRSKIRSPSTPPQVHSSMYCNVLQPEGSSHIQSQMDNSRVLDYASVASAIRNTREVDASQEASICRVALLRCNTSQLRDSDVMVGLTGSVRVGCIQSQLVVLVTFFFSQ